MNGMLLSVLKNCKRSKGKSVCEVSADGSGAERALLSEGGEGSDLGDVRMDDIVLLAPVNQRSVWGKGRDQK